MRQDFDPRLVVGKGMEWDAPLVRLKKPMDRFGPPSFKFTNVIWRPDHSGVNPLMNCGGLLC
jgi:hypothetical protein